MKKGLVSICIPTYNGEKYLQEALDSVKVQTYKNIEVIISDDNSKDKTLEIGERFKNEVDFPVYLYNHAPAGIGANWNHCIEKAHGEYIQFLFQDDVLYSNCISEKLKYLQNYKLQAVCCKRDIIDEKGLPLTLGKWYEECHDLQKIYLNLDIDDFYILKKNDLKNLIYKNATANIFGEPISFMFDRTLFKKLGYFSTTSKQILDIEFGYRILKKYPVGLIAEPLFKFRLHSDQATASNRHLGSTIKKEYDDLKAYLFKNFFFCLSSDFRKQYFKEKYPELYRKLINLKYFNFK